MADLSTLSEFIRYKRQEIILSSRTLGQSFQLMSRVQQADYDDGILEGNLVKQITIDEQLENPRVDFTVTIRNSPELNGLINLMDVLLYYSDEYNYDQTVDYGLRGAYYVVEINDNDDEYTKTLRCQNAGLHLMRHRYYLKLNKGETTAQFMRRMCDAKGIPIGNIESTMYGHDARLFPNTSLYDAFYNLMSTNRLQERRSFRMSFSPQNRFNFEEVQEQNTMWIFEAKNNPPSQGEEQGTRAGTSVPYTELINPRRKVSILDTAFLNKAIAIKTEDVAAGFSFLPEGLGGNAEEEKTERVAIRWNRESVDMYGQFPVYVDVTNFGKPEEIESRLQEIVDIGSTPPETLDFSTHAFGNLKPGDRFCVHYPVLGSLGIYFIESLKTVIKEKSSVYMIHGYKQRNLSEALLDQLRESTTIDPDSGSFFLPDF